MCIHCYVRKANRPRRLCWSCYYRPGVRDLYPDRNNYGIKDFSKRALPTRPTNALPGTEDKIKVFIERAKKGEELFHKDDAPCSFHR